MNIQYNKLQSSQKPKQRQQQSQKKQKTHQNFSTSFQDMISILKDQRQNMDQKLQQIKSNEQQNKHTQSFYQDTSFNDQYNTQQEQTYNSNQNLNLEHSFMKNIYKTEEQQQKPLSKYPIKQLKRPQSSSKYIQRNPRTYSSHVQPSPLNTSNISIKTKTPLKSLYNVSSDLKIDRKIKVQKTPNKKQKNLRILQNKRNSLSQDLNKLTTNYPAIDLNQNSHVDFVSQLQDKINKIKNNQQQSNNGAYDPINTSISNPYHNYHQYGNKTITDMEDLQNDQFQALGISNIKNDQQYLNTSNNNHINTNNSFYKLPKKSNNKAHNLSYDELQIQQSQKQSQNYDLHDIPEVVKRRRIVRKRIQSSFGSYHTPTISNMQEIKQVYMGGGLPAGNKDHNTSQSQKNTQQQLKSLINQNSEIGKQSKSPLKQFNQGYQSMVPSGKQLVYNSMNKRSTLEQKKRSASSRHKRVKSQQKNYPAIENPEAIAQQNQLYEELYDRDISVQKYYNPNQDYREIQKENQKNQKNLDQQYENYKTNFDKLMKAQALKNYHILNQTYEKQGQEFTVDSINISQNKSSVQQQYRGISLSNWSNVRHQNSDMVNEVSDLQEVLRFELDRQLKDVNVLKQVNQYLIDYNLPDNLENDYIQLREQQQQ